jgi:hypothetical protein
MKKLLLIVCLAVVACALLGCSSPSTSASAWAVTTGGRATVAWGGPSGRVVLLSEAWSQAGYYNGEWAWHDFEAPVFALWPDDRMLVRVDGGYGYSPPQYLEGRLTADQSAEVGQWLREADLTTLEISYPGTGTMPATADATECRLQVRDPTKQIDVAFALGYPIGDTTYPERLSTLVKRLLSCRPTGSQPFVPDEIEVFVNERSRDRVPATGYFPLPAEFDLQAMEEVQRSIEQVTYRAVYRGEEAARIAARIDAGEHLYVSPKRSYWVQYRPLIEWPKP